MNRHELCLYKQLHMVNLHWRHTQTNPIICLSQPTGYVALRRRTIINDKLEWCRDLVQHAIPQLSGNSEEKNEKVSIKMGFYAESRRTASRLRRRSGKFSDALFDATLLLRLASPQSSPLKSSGYSTYHHVCHSHILLVRSTHSVNVLYISQKKQRLFH